MQIVSPGVGVLTNATLSSVNVSNYGVAVPPYHPAIPSQADYVDGVYGVLARNDAKGSLTISGLAVNNTPITSVPASGTGLANQSNGRFTFNFLTLPITLTVQSNPAGHSFIVDGTNYPAAQSFNWTPGSSHAIGTGSPQNSGAGVQDVWSSWSDGGAISHTVTPLANTTYTANFTTQYYLTMDAGTGGSVTPGSGWKDDGANVNLRATPSPGFSFSGWTGTGSGSYSGSDNPASITMKGPVTQTANFTSPPPSQNIFHVTVGSNSVVTLAYATAPGFVYHVEVTTNLSPAHWTIIDGSITNASATSVVFTDTNQSAAAQRYYRTVSP